jgi:putative hydrolase of the HAD superfamily
MLPRAVLFDLDNTLVHRNLGFAAYARQFVIDFRAALAESETAESVAAVIMESDCGGYLPSGSPFTSIKQAVTVGLVNEFAWRDPPSLERILAHWSDLSPTHVVEMPGALSLIDGLVDRGLAVGIVSNGAERTRRMAVEALGIGQSVRSLLSSERAGVRKPDTRIFAIAAQELGVEPDECWFVGDHPVNDIVGALATGMQAVWLRGFHDWPRDQVRPPMSVDSLLELLPLLRSGT